MTAVRAVSPPDIATLLVSEVFGPTIQGEGPTSGRRCSFLRLGDCNLACTWCDTPFTWDSDRFDLRAELAHRPVHVLADQLLSGDVDRVVITGGEPLLHQRRTGWRQLLEVLRRAGVAVEVETNGTIPPHAITVEHVTAFNVSPKLASAGMDQRRRVRMTALRALRDTGKAAFKFVCRTPGDVDEAAELVDQADIPAGAVWVMPEGTTASDVNRHLAVIADHVVRRGFNLCTRLHVLAWGDERGR